MEHSCLQNEIFSCVLEFGGFILTILSGIIAIGYWLEPCFKVSIEKIESTSDHIRVTVSNNNIFRNKIKDIHCEMTLSSVEDFSGDVRTLELIKSWIVCLNKKPAFYVFKAELDHIKHKSNHIDGMKHIRVRILAPNFLGVKKVKEKIFPV